METPLYSHGLQIRKNLRLLDRWWVGSGIRELRRQDRVWRRDYGENNIKLDGTETHLRWSKGSNIVITYTGVSKIRNTANTKLSYQLRWPPLWSSGQSSWLHNGEVMCFLWGTNWIYICYVEESRPPLWSSGQSSWLQILRPGFDSRRYQIFWDVVGLERGPLSLVSTTEELLERKSSGPGLENS
jgi:hypothetical protein